MAILNKVKKFTFIKTDTFPFLNPAALEKAEDYKWPEDTHAVVSSYPSLHSPPDQCQKTSSHWNISTPQEKDQLDPHLSDFKYAPPPPALSQLQVFPPQTPNLQFHYHFLGLQHKLWHKCTQHSSIHRKIKVTISSSNSYINHFTFLFFFPFIQLWREIAVQRGITFPTPLRVNVQVSVKKQTGTATLVWLFK